MSFDIEVEEVTVKFDTGGFAILQGIAGYCDDDGSGVWETVASTVICDHTGLIVATFLDQDGSNAEWREYCDGVVTDPLTEAMDAEAARYTFDSHLGGWVR